MNTFPLPLNINTINSFDEINIDMSSLHFDVCKDKQKHAAFVFIRNSGIKANFDFSNCGYYDKEEYLINYLCEDVEVDIEILTTTWLEILLLSTSCDIILPSILSKDEIIKFRYVNKELVDNIMSIINSLPMYSIYLYNKNILGKNIYNQNDYDKIKIANFYKLANYDCFIFLIDGLSEPQFYNNLFIKDDPYITTMINKLPYNGLLDLIVKNNNEMNDKFIKDINEMLESITITEEIGNGIDHKTY